MGLNRFGSDVVSVDPVRIREFVKRFKDHPAIVGWYTADEPSGIIQKGLCQIAYDAIKAVDTAHPVFLCSNKSDDSTILLFAPAYDVLIFDTYVFNQGDSRILSYRGPWFFMVEGNRVENAIARCRRPVPISPIDRGCLLLKDSGRALGCDTRLPHHR